MFDKARTDIDLLRGFWNLTEKPIVKMGSRAISHHMAVNSLLEIPCTPVNFPLDVCSDGDISSKADQGAEVVDDEEQRLVTVTGRVLTSAAAVVAKAKGHDGCEVGLAVQCRRDCFQGRARRAA